MTQAQKIRENIDNLLCQYVEEYGQDPDQYDFSSIDNEINAISNGINPLDEQ